jgi:hypothetical protein
MNKLINDYLSKGGVINIVRPKEKRCVKGYKIYPQPITITKVVKKIFVFGKVFLRRVK